MQQKKKRKKKQKKRPGQNLRVVVRRRGAGDSDVAQLEVHVAQRVQSGK